MKKAKLMLGAVVVFAVVGGALAFKARTDLGEYCTLTTAVGHQAGQDCTISVTDAEVGAIPNPTVYYTTNPDAVDCADLTCPNTGRIIEQ